MAVTKYFDDFMGEYQKAGMTEITTKQAQQLKKRVYRDLQTAYAKMLNAPVNTRVQMEVAKNARLALEEIVPEIKKLNKEDGALLDLRDALVGPESRLANKDLISMREAIVASAGGRVMGAPVIAVGAGLGLLDRGHIKAKIGVVLNRLQKKGVNVKPNSTLLRMGLIKVGQTWHLVEDKDKKSQED